MDKRILALFHASIEHSTLKVLLRDLRLQYQNPRNKPPQFSIQFVAKLTAAILNAPDNFLNFYAATKIIYALFRFECVNLAELPTAEFMKLINILSRNREQLNALRLQRDVDELLLQLLNFVIESSQKGSIDGETLDDLRQVRENIRTSRSGDWSTRADLQTRLRDIEWHCTQESLQDKLDGFGKLFDLFSECPDYAAQLKFFAVHVHEIVKKLLSNLQLTREPEKLEQLMLMLGRTLQTILVKTTYLIEVDAVQLRHLREVGLTKKNNVKGQLEYLIIAQENCDVENKTDQGVVKSNPESTAAQSSAEDKQQVILPYTAHMLEDALQGCEQQLYDGVALVINALLMFPKNTQIMRYCLLSLERFYFTFRQHQDSLEEPLLSVLQSIARLPKKTSDDTVALFKNGALFIQRIFLDEDSSENFKQQLAQIEEFKSNEFYQEKYVQEDSSLNVDVIRLQDLVIRSSFAVQHNVQAEKRFSQNIEVRRPFSILYVGFATFRNDIQLKVCKVADFDNAMIASTTSGSAFAERVYFEQKVNSEMEPFKIVLLVERPGIYRISFDNSYSWYNQKILRVRTCLLEPELTEKVLRGLLEIYNNNNNNSNNSKNSNNNSSSQSAKTNTVFTPDFKLLLNNESNEGSNQQKNSKNLTIILNEGFLRCKFDSQDWVRFENLKGSTSLREIDQVLASSYKTEISSLVIITTQQSAENVIEQYNQALEAFYASQNAQQSNFEPTLQLLLDDDRQYFKLSDLKDLIRQEFPVLGAQQRPNYQFSINIVDQQDLVYEKVSLSKKNQGCPTLYVNVGEKSIGARSYHTQCNQLRDLGELLDVRNGLTFKESAKKIQINGFLALIEQLLYTIVFANTQDRFQFIYVCAERDLHNQLFVGDTFARLQENVQRRCNRSQNAVFEQIDISLENWIK